MYCHSRVYKTGARLAFSSDAVWEVGGYGRCSLIRTLLDTWTDTGVSNESFCEPSPPRRRNGQMKSFYWKVIIEGLLM